MCFDISVDLWYAGEMACDVDFTVCRISGGIYRGFHWRMNKVTWCRWTPYWLIECYNWWSIYKTNSVVMIVFNVTYDVKAYIPVTGGTNTNLPSGRRTDCTYAFLQSVPYVVMQPAVQRHMSKTNNVHVLPRIWLVRDATVVEKYASSW